MRWNGGDGTWANTEVWTQVQVDDVGSDDVGSVDVGSGNFGSGNFGSGFPSSTVCVGESDAYEVSSPNSIVRVDRMQLLPAVVSITISGQNSSLLTPAHHLRA